MIYDHWDLVAADLISEYACNVYDREQRSRWTWAAGRVMIGGLFAAETRIARWYDQEHGSGKEAAASPTARGRG
jgi:hypothetical protein